MVAGEKCTGLFNKLSQKIVLRDCMSMCFGICTINIRVSIRVRGLHLVCPMSINDKEITNLPHAISCPPLYGSHVHLMSFHCFIKRSSHLVPWVAHDCWWLLDHALMSGSLVPACSSNPLLTNALIEATSSTAQGGGGSFKNRKPIGEVGCGESGMAERSHWWIERWLISLTLSLSFSDYLSVYLFIYLSIYLSSYLSI